ncbi:MAG TPA: hypothetical protein DDW17_01000 [Deltaproteobacteria bacterium]|nr:hypothetical protein [Deltaproteobacteria bacterium]
MKLDPNFFVKQQFSLEEIEKYKKSAKRNLETAISSKEPEVIFHFAYMSLIKMGIYRLAKSGYRVKSKPGHHQKIIEYLSQMLKSEDIIIIGDKMRKDRNLDFYSADVMYSEKEIKEYLEFVKNIYKQI